MKKIDIATDFSKFLGLRKRARSKHSGEEFRDDILIPALQTLKLDEQLEITLDGTTGFGSSFLEEVFGGLVRKKISPKIINSIQFVSEKDPSLINEIESYIADARRDQKK